MACSKSHTSVPNTKPLFNQAFRLVGVRLFFLRMACDKLFTACLQFPVHKKEFGPRRNLTGLSWYRHLTDYPPVRDVYQSKIPELPTDSPRPSWWVSHMSDIWDLKSTIKSALKPHRAKEKTISARLRASRQIQSIKSALVKQSMFYFFMWFHVTQCWNWICVFCVTFAIYAKNRRHVTLWKKVSRTPALSGCAPVDGIWRNTFMFFSGFYRLWNFCSNSKYSLAFVILTETSKKPESSSCLLGASLIYHLHMADF